MNTQTSGGDSDTPAVINPSAFGIEDAANPSPQVEAQTQQDNKVEEKEEDAHVEQKEESETKDSDQVKSLRKQADESHKLVIDIIGDKLKQLEQKQLTDVELRKWFDEHPNIAEKANRSKKYKDQFRALMERDQATQYDSDLKAKRDEQTKDEGTDDDQDDSGFKGERDVATKADIRKLLDEHTRDIEEKMLESRLKNQRQDEATDFAAENGINEEEFEKFFKTADAIYKVNDDIDFKQALKAAHSAIYESKDKPINVSSHGKQDVQTSKNEVEKMMSQHGLSKEVANVLVSQGKTAANLDLSQGIQLMTLESFK